MTSITLRGNRQPDKQQRSVIVSSLMSNRRWFEIGTFWRIVLEMFLFLGQISAQNNSHGQATGGTVRALQNTLLTSTSLSVAAVLTKQSPTNTTSFPPAHNGQVSHASSHRTTVKSSAGGTGTPASSNLLKTTSLSTAVHRGASAVDSSSVISTTAVTDKSSSADLFNTTTPLPERLPENGTNLNDSSHVLAMNSSMNATRLGNTTADISSHGSAFNASAFNSSSYGVSGNISTGATITALRKKPIKRTLLQSRRLQIASPFNRSSSRVSGIKSTEVTVVTTRTKLMNTRSLQSKKQLNTTSLQRTLHQSLKTPHSTSKTFHVPATGTHGGTGRMGSTHPLPSVHHNVPGQGHQTGSNGNTTAFKNPRVFMNNDLDKQHTNDSPMKISGDSDNDLKDDKDDLTNKSYTIDEGMLPFYRLAKAIAGEGFVTEYPFQLLEDVTSGSISLSALMKPMYFHAYIAEVVLGVTVVLALMVANCTFCKENKTPVRSSHAVALTRAKKGMRRVRIVSIACVILLVLALVGLITAAMSNSQQTEAFKQLFGVAHAALSRVVHVLDSIIWQMTTAFNEMLLSTQRFQVDLAKINETVDYSVQEELENLTGINKSLEALKAFEVTREQTYTALWRLDRDLDVYNQRVSELSAKMIGASNISNSSVVYPPLNVSTINVSLSLVDLEKIGENKDKFTSAVVVSAANVSRVVFASDTGAVDVSKAISKGILGSPLFRSILEGFKNKLVSVMQLEGNKEMVKKAKEKLMFYDNYRQMFMVIALVVEAIPMVILFAGAVMTPMVFTRFIKDSQSPMPHQIEVVADCLQTDSVPLMMSVLWMTLAVVYFAVGALTEGLVCMPVCDPEFRVLDVLVEDYDIMGEHGNTTWLANMLNMSDSNMTLGSVLKGCRRNDTLYTAMQLYLHPYVSIDQFFSFRDDINISGMLEVLQPEIVTSEALTPDILEYLQDLSDAADSVPLDDLNDLVKMDVARNMTHLRSELPEDLYTLLHALQIHKTTLNESLQEVKKLLTPNDQSLSKAISEAINATRQAENMIPLVNETAVDNGKDTAKGRLLENLDTGLKNVKWRIEERVGGCEPLYDLVKKVLLVGLCSNVTNTVNGFWLALGWLNLFLVPVVFLCAWLHRQIMKLPISPDPLHSSDFFWEKEEPVKPPSEDYSCGDDTSLYDYDMDRRQGKLGWRRPWDHFTSPDPADQYRGYWGSEFMDHQEAGRRSRLARSSSPESSEYLELMDQVYGYRGSPENYRANDQTPWNQDDTRSYTQPRENGMYDNQPARGYEPYENDELDYQDGGGYDRQPYNQPHYENNMPGPQSRRL